MGDTTGIEWTDATWNPVRGCSRVSEGCRNCYAEKVAARFAGPGLPYEGLARRTAGGEARWTGKVRFVPEHLDDPLRWKRPRRIFVNSMSDLFHESLDVRDIDRVFAVMLLSPRHTFQILTKRPARMRAYMNAPDLYRRLLDAVNIIRIARPELGSVGVSNPWLIPPRWIWLGVSVEDQAAADERIPLLLQTPSAVRFLSCEPLLGPVDLLHLQPNDPPVEIDALNGTHGVLRPHGGRNARVDWVIAGGESGPGARPMHPGWARSLRDQCAGAGVPFFFKQWGDWAPENTHDSTARDSVRIAHVGDDMGEMWRVGKKAAGSLLDGVDHKAFPA